MGLLGWLGPSHADVAAAPDAALVCTRRSGCGPVSVPMCSTGLHVAATRVPHERDAWIRSPARTPARWPVQTIAASGRRRNPPSSPGAPPGPATPPPPLSPCQGTARTGQRRSRDLDGGGHGNWTLTATRSGRTTSASRDTQRSDGHRSCPCSASRLARWRKATGGSVPPPEHQAAPFRHSSDARHHRDRALGPRRCMLPGAGSNGRAVRRPRVNVAILRRAGSFVPLGTGRLAAALGWTGDASGGRHTTGAPVLRGRGGRLCWIDRRRGPGLLCRRNPRWQRCRVFKYPLDHRGRSDRHDHPRLARWRA